MAGLIRGDELEIFHILRPEVRVKGRITKAYQLSSIAEVDEKDVQKFHQVLHNIYEVSKPRILESYPRTHNLLTTALVVTHTSVAVYADSFLRRESGDEGYMLGFARRPGRKIV